MSAQRSSAAWWSIVSAVLTMGGLVWNGVTIDPVWDVDYDYILEYRPLPGVWRIDFSGRWARAAEVKDDPAPPLVWKFDSAGRLTRAALTKDERLGISAELIDAKELDKGDIREIPLGQGGGRIDPKTGRFWCSVVGDKIDLYHGQPVRLRLTVRVDNKNVDKVTVAGTVRLKR